MARVQYGSIVTDLKGSIGGQVFQGGNRSKVLRNKGYSKGTSSQARQVANQNIQRQSTRWRICTDLQRAAWNTAATTWPFVDRFGNVYYSGGYQCFVAFNAGLAILNETLVYDPNIPVSAEAFTGLSLAVDESSVMDLSWDDVGTQNQHMCVYMTQGSTPGKSQNNLKYRLIGTYQMNGSSVIDLNADYNAVFGGRAGDDIIYFYVEVRVDVYPRAVMRTYGQGLVT